MNREQYLAQPEVNRFAEWLVSLIDTPNGFLHSYNILRNNGTWECNSIYNAYEQYDWRFKCQMPTGVIHQGRSYMDNQIVLTQLRTHINDAFISRDNDSLREGMKSILKWGGVLGSERRGNFRRILEIESPIEYLQTVGNLIAIETIDLDQTDVLVANDILINAGFTKIYSILIDNFIIYDSRVGAALGLLARKFLEAENEHTIPPTLSFSWAPGRGAPSAIAAENRRNPSLGHFQFKSFSTDKWIHWLDNIRASWLVESVANGSRFAENCELDSPSRRMEAALFMIGYDVRYNNQAN